MDATTARSGGSIVAAAGAGMVALAVVLYATGLSRAVGVVLGAVAAVVLIGGVSIRRRGRWPRRSFLLAFAVVVAGLAVVGVWALVIGLSTVPSAA
jgi:hypothetical protein